MFENIRKLRLEHGLTQKELAEIVGITQQCVNNYENRSTQPSFIVLMKMADYFHVSLDYLCLGKESLHQTPADPRMTSYTKEDQMHHQNLFATLPVNQKRTIDNLIRMLSGSDPHSGNSGAGSSG
ncbi:MAG: helix-turn-helix transcriptional regulator [Firmicutes bacterium]|nr:helix-turn-helix transcriptional regulator [Bacillota bacterium]